MKQIGVEHKVALKRKRTRQIVAIVMLSVVLAVAALVIAAACVNVNLAPSTILPPSTITIYNKTEQHGYLSSSEDQAKFMEKYNDMFDTSYLNALFGGSLGGYTISSQTNAKKFSSIQTELREGYYVNLHYLTPQKLSYSNGEACMNANKLVAEQLTFTDAYFAISESDNLADFKIYVVVNLTQKSSSSTATPDDVLELHLKANTSTLYASLSDFKTN